MNISLLNGVSNFGGIQDFRKPAAASSGKIFGVMIDNPTQLRFSVSTR
jgi:hypothetical protein